MNIFKRFKNLWKLSEWEPSIPVAEKKLKPGDKVSMIIKKREMAKIVDLSDDVDLN